MEQFRDKYRLGFDILGLVVFLMVMIPNFIWFAIPAPNDVLRAESVTPVIDVVAQVFQILFVASLCFVVNKERRRLSFSPLAVVSVACIVVYYVGWGIYYYGVSGPLVILLLTVPPCAAFVSFAAERKNRPAVLFATGFAVCHLIFGIVNYMVPCGTASVIR